MRITVSHTKGQKEAMRIVDEAADQLFRPDLPGLLRMVDLKKSWAGNTMNFSLAAKFALIRVPLRGTITVTDTNITIEMELPALLTKLFPEKKIRGGMEKKVKGLLT